MGFRRYVALGDSTTEGLDDPRPGGGYRGWADRLAERLASEEPGLLYANLAVRGRRIPRCTRSSSARRSRSSPTSSTGGRRPQRRAPPPLRRMTVSAGHLEAMLPSCARPARRLATFTLPDLSPVVPLGTDRARAAGCLQRSDVRDRQAHGDDRLRPRERADLPRPAGVERRPAAREHARPRADRRGDVRDARPPGQRRHVGGGAAGARRRAPHAVVAAELVWARRHFGPRLVRRARGRSSGDGRVPKAPERSRSRCHDGDRRLHRSGAGARRRGLRRGPQGVERRHRPPAGADRPLHSAADVVAAVPSHASATCWWRCAAAGTTSPATPSATTADARPVADEGDPVDPRRDRDGRRRASRWGELDRATQAYGLATTGGKVSTPGSPA